MTKLALISFSSTFELINRTSKIFYNCSFINYFVILRPNYLCWMILIGSILWHFRVIKRTKVRPKQSPRHTNLLLRPKYFKVLVTQFLRIFVAPPEVLWNVASLTRSMFYYLEFLIGASLMAQWHYSLGYVLAILLFCNTAKQVCWSKNGISANLNSKFIGFFSWRVDSFSAQYVISKTVSSQAAQLGIQFINYHIKSSLFRALIKDSLQCQGK